MNMTMQKVGAHDCVYRPGVQCSIPEAEKPSYCEKCGWDYNVERQRKIMARRRLAAARDRSEHEVWSIFSKAILKITDSMDDIISKMSDGNNGAEEIVRQFLEKGKTGMMYILRCDSLGIRGKRLYILWNECCNRDIELVKKVLQMYDQHELSEQDINNHIDGDGMNAIAFEFDE